MTTAREMIDSLTGFEEDAIERLAGVPLEVLADGRRDLKLTRVLGAVKLFRENEDLSYDAAWQKIQAMPQTELGAVFEDEPDDFIPTEPDSEAGKDDSTPPDEPTSSPPSASQPE